MTTMEEFFGFAKPSEKPTVAKVKKAVDEKLKEAEKIQKSPNKTPEQKEMIDYLEEMGLLPVQKNNPAWKEKRSEAQNSILSTLGKITGAKID
jgi:hypothetical protein